MKYTLLHHYQFTVLALTIMLVYVLASDVMSRSGAHKILRMNGNMSTTNVYENDTLYYTSNTNIIRESVLKALESESKHYIIVIK